LLMKPAERVIRIGVLSAVIVLVVWCACASARADQIDDTLKLLYQAGALAGQGKLVEAEVPLKKILASDPENVFALLRLGGIRARQKRWKECLDAWQKVVKKVGPADKAAVVQDWHVAGPFPNPNEGKGLDIAYPPEKTVDLQATYDGKNKQKIKWKKMTAQQVRDLSAAWPQEDVVIYGYATIESDADKLVELRVGSDDGEKTWLNGRQVLRVAQRRGVNPDQDRALVRLKKGRNTLLIKVEQGKGQYGFTAKIVYVPTVDPKAMEYARKQHRITSTTAGVFMSAEGMMSKSNWWYMIFQKDRCVKRCRAGRWERVPPGNYDIAVGFPSGWVRKPYDLKVGTETIIPTGLLKFKEVTPSNLRTTIPQMLYLGNEYLCTAYQGDTARLYPGRYRICYQDMLDPLPVRPFERWHVIGLFQAKNRIEVFNTVYPPEKGIDLKKPCQVGNAKFTWVPTVADPRVDFRKVLGTRYNSAAYAVGFYKSNEEKQVEVDVDHRGPLKIWFNGKLMCEDPPQRPNRRVMSRNTFFPTLKKGENVILIKALYWYGDWDLCATVANYKMYDVNVVADK